MKHAMTDVQVVQTNLTFKTYTFEHTSTQVGKLVQGSLNTKLTKTFICLSINITEATVPPL